MLRWWFVVVFVLSLGLIGRTAAAGNQVKAQLLADTSAIVPGRPFTLGVLLKITPQWHVYWKNPGDSGLAPSVKFELPEGFTVSELEFPIPTKFLQPGDLIAYGYTDSVLLTAKITPAKDLAAGSSVSIKAAVSWLVCDEVCVPGNANVELSLPVASAAQAANGDVFDIWNPRMPVGASATDAPGSIETQGVLGEGGKSGAFTIKVKWKQDVSDVEFFPGRSRALSIHDATVQNKGKVTTITLMADALKGQSLEVPSLSCVVAYTDVQGVRRGVSVELPLKK